MVFLILTRAGFDELKTHGAGASSAWFNPGLLSQEEILQMQGAGMHLTALDDEVDPSDPIEVAHAVSAVRQRAADPVIWVEQAVRSQALAEPDTVAAAEPEQAAPAASGWKAMSRSILAKAAGALDSARRHLPAGMGFPDGPYAIIPYAGYGTGRNLVMTGRVIRDKGHAAPLKEGTGWQNLLELYKRLETDEVPGARVRIRFGETATEVVADSEGYFLMELDHGQTPVAPGWHAVTLELTHPAPRQGQPAVQASGQVLVPPDSARFGIISDIDDTIVWTNVTNKLGMLAMLARSNAHTRKPFKGVAAFYRALCDGASGDENNPIFYVSSSPWNLYVPLVEFMAVNGIPSGPLFLRDFGGHILFSSHQQDHKQASIEKILATYPNLPFVLIGDSGERDPEIYTSILKKYPERIRIIYIRNVNPDPARVEAIDRLIEEVRQTGAQLILAPDTEVAASHAAGEGLLSSRRMAAVRSEKSADTKAPAVPGSEGVPPA